MTKVFLQAKRVDTHEPMSERMGPMTKHEADRVKRGMLAKIRDDCFVDEWPADTAEALSAKQIIADLGAAADVMDEEPRHHIHADAIDAAIAYIKAMQPRPIEEAQKGQHILALWIKNGSTYAARSTFWGGKPRWLDPPTHFIPLSALPLPEGE